MRYAIRLATEVFDELRAHVARFLPREAAAIVLVGRAGSADDRHETLLGRRAVPLQPDAYEIQGPDRLVIRPRFINSILALCESNNLGVMFCHSHPADVPFSGSDYEGESRLYEVFSRFLPDLPFASLLLCPTMTMARVWTLDGPRDVDGLRLVGPTMIDVTLGGRRMVRLPAEAEQFDRQVRTLGDEGQARVAGTRVAVVGVGGTGSPTAEQLTRLGVRDLIIIDSDVVDVSTPTRGYGVFPEHVIPRAPWWRHLLRLRTRPVSKVSAIGDHLRRIAPRSRIRTIEGDVVERRVAELLLDRDFVFLCVDEHWGRAVVNQVAYQYLIPAINTGVRLDVREGRLVGAAGSIHVLRPGVACLWCSNSLDSDRIRAESLSRTERLRLERESYVVGLESRAPMVVSLTTTISGLAVTAFLNYVTGFLEADATLTRQNYYIQEGIVSRGFTNVRPGCLCGQIAGFGDLKPLIAVERRPR